MGSSRLFLTVVLVTLFAHCLAQGKVCKKKLKGKFSTITVKAKGTCVLDSVKGNLITILPGGNLTVKGISEIAEIDPRDGAIITLTNKTSVTTVTVTNEASIDISVEEKSVVKNLLLNEAGETTARGTFGSVSSEGSGVLKLESGTIRRSVRIVKGKGLVRLCGLVIKKETVIKSRRGRLILGDFKKKCSGSRFEGSLKVTGGGGGSLTLQSSFASSVSVSNRAGDVTLSSSSFGKTSVTGVSGDVSLTSSTVRRTSKLENIKGAITVIGTGFFGSVLVAEKKSSKVGPTTIRESSFQKRKKDKGDLRLTVSRRRKLTVTFTNLFNGTAVFKKIAGPVVFNGNGDADVSFSQNRKMHIFENNIDSVGLTKCGGGILIEKNVIRNGRIESCSGKITIERNVFRKLKCSANNPAPVGKENAIAKSASGQCSKFRR